MKQGLWSPSELFLLFSFCTSQFADKRLALPSLSQSSDSLRRGNEGCLFMVRLRLSAILKIGKTSPKNESEKRVHDGVVTDNNLRLLPYPILMGRGLSL